MFAILLNLCVISWIHLLCHFRTYLFILPYWCYGALIILFKLLTFSPNCKVRVLTLSFISEFLFSLSQPALATIFASVQKSFGHFDILSDQVIYAFLRRALFLITWNIVQRLCNGFSAARTFYSHDFLASEGMISQRLHVALELLVSDGLQ